jgi:hypothetical protein
MIEYIAMAIYSLGIIGQLGDCYTTEIGLSHGLKEGNTMATWIVSKIGVTGITLLKCLGFAGIAPIVATVFAGYYGLIAVSAAAAIAGIISTVLNYFLLKKHNIPVK